MIKNVKKIGCILMIFVLVLSTAGCIPVGFSAQSTGSADVVANTPTVNADDDNMAKKVLSEFFIKLFADVEVDSYAANTRTGKIPDKIREHIAETTIAEGDGNPEISIHLPRFISVNGMTTIHYNIEMLPNDSTKANITSGFISMTDDNLLYFNKIIVKAKVVPDKLFEEWYKLQEDNTYSPVGKVDAAYIDEMRLEIRYDVELVKTGSTMKVLRAIESNMKPGFKNRVFRMNNDSVTRLPYLDLSRTADGNNYINTADGEAYEAEKAVITAFFNNLTKLDRARMNLLSHKWKQGYQEVEKYWDSLGIIYDGDSSSKLVRFDVSFDKNYPIASLPLCNNMEKLKGIQNLTATPHPAYSKNLKWYFVNFEAPVQRTNGITDEDFLYRYDYLVMLSEEKGALYIEKFKLNEYHNIK